MKSVNFMPSYRIVARQRRRRIRLWTVVIGVTLVLELVGIACGYGLWCGGRMVLAKEEDRAAATIQSADRAIRMLQGELATQEATLKANQALEGQPDWSRMLSLLAQSLGDGVIVKRCELKPRPPAGPVTPASAPLKEGDAYALKVSGVGRAVADVLQFAGALERSGLFDQIRLVKTDTEPFLSGTATVFEMECALGGKTENPK
jgi:Tfp pilus assembly protein PilN